MGKTKLTAKLLHLKREKAEALEQLAIRLDIKQSELMREAIDLLLKKYKVKMQVPMPK